MGPRPPPPIIFYIYCLQLFHILFKGTKYISLLVAQIINISLIFFAKYYTFYINKEVVLLLVFKFLNANINNIINTNSKYKEDNFTDSNAVAYSQDVFIYFLHEAPTCQTPLIHSPLTPLHIPALSQVRRVELVTAPTQVAS